MGSDLVDFGKGIDSFFAPFYDTVALVDQMIHDRRNALDLLTLICARLDGLAMLSVQEGTGNREAFVRFVLKYAGEADLLTQVSIGDVVWSLTYYAYAAEALVPAPGRITLFHPDDRDFVTFIDRLEDLAITKEGIEDLCTRIADILFGAYRPCPHQRKSKKESDSVKAVLEALKRGLDRRPTRRLLDKFEAAASSWLKRFTLIELMYQDYRNKAVHGTGPVVNKTRFWSDTTPYWEAYSREFDTRDTLNVEFPARFMIRILRNALNQYSIHLKAKRIVPSEIHSAIYGDSWLKHVDSLDVDLISEGRRVSLNTGR